MQLFEGCVDFYSMKHSGSKTASRMKTQTLKTQARLLQYSAGFVWVASYQILIMHMGCESNVTRSILICNPSEKCVQQGLLLLIMYTGLCCVMEFGKALGQYSVSCHTSVC